MTADSSTATSTHSGEGGGVDSPSRRRSLPSPWAQVVRGGGEPDVVAPQSPLSSPLSSPSPVVAEQNAVFSDPFPVLEPETAATAETQPEGSDVSNNGNAGALKRSPWNKPSTNGVVEGTTTPVMGAASWPALSESTRPVQKSLSFSSESSPKPTSDGSTIASQAPVLSQPPHQQAKSSSTSHSNPSHTHHARQRPMKRGGGSGGATAGYTRPPPPPPPPLPPPFPLFDMSYGNLVPPVLESPVREQPPYTANTWGPRPVGGVGSHSHMVQDHSSNRNPSRRNNFGPRPRGDGGLYLNNGYGARRDHHDRDWHGPRSPATRDVQIPHQMVPPPPPAPRAYVRQPHPGPAPPYIAPQPLRPYGTPMGYEMATSFLYVPTPPPEPYRGAPLLPPAAPPSMFMPVMDHPLHVLILNQIEYYFSDANLVKDNFLRSNMDEEGWVPITLIAGFPRVQSLTTDIQMILNSLRDSSSVEVQGDKLRRHNEWRKWVQPSDRFPTDSTSQSPHAETDTSEEISIGKLMLNDPTTNQNSILETKEGVGASNGEDSTKEAHI